MAAPPPRMVLRVLSAGGADVSFEGPGGVSLPQPGRDRGHPQDAGCLW